VNRLEKPLHDIGPAQVLELVAVPRNEHPEGLGQPLLLIRREARPDRGEKLRSRAQSHVRI
jgi:hypothetical protein